MHDKPFGHNFKKKQRNTIRVVSFNINGLPAKTKDTKNTILRQFIERNNIHILLSSELNIHWKDIPVKHRLRNRCKTWFESLHLSVAYYKDYDKHKGSRQFGGTSVWSVNKTAHRVMERGEDKRQLGRWAWTRYRGKSGKRATDEKGITLRVVSAYRPCRTSSASEGTVYKQHEGYFLSNNMQVCPRKQFTLDLVEEAKQWLEAGDQVVIGIDVNEQIDTSNLTKALKKIGLTEICQHAHGVAGPPTHISGSKVIDGIYVSHSLLGCRCGYLPIHDELSDHRPMWIEIPTSIGYGHNVPPLHKPKARRCQTTDPRVADKFIKVYEEELKSNHMMERVTKLEHQTNISPFQLNLIDRMRSRCINKADRQCRKFRTGAKPWSPSLQKTRIKARYWHKMKCKKEGKQKVSTRHLERLAEKAGVQHSLDHSVEYMTDMWRHSVKIRDRQANSGEELRSTHMYRLAQAKVEANETEPLKEQRELNLKIAKKLESMVHVEKQRTDARIIRATNGKLHSGGIACVIGPASDGTRKEYHKKTDMENALLAENARRFNQAAHTPFLQPPLYDAVGPLGTGPAANEILSGNYVPPPTTDPYACKLIPHLQRPNNVVEQTQLWTEEELTTSWNDKSEFKSSGKSGIHFGHCKAATSNETTNKFETQFANLTYKTGITLDRWKTGLNVMLLKKPGNFNVEKLRAILLYEADFNMNNRKCGRDMMYTAETLGNIAPEQYGSRRHHSSIMHCVNKVLTLDLVRQQKRAACMCSNDAKSCYDRIVHSVASLCMQRLGAKLEPIVCMFSTLQGLRHHIRTIYGDSDISFGGDIWVIPCQGVGQGNAAGPHIWAAVSTPLLNMMRAEGHTAFFKAALSGDTIEFVGYAFVDDTDLMRTGRTLDAKGSEVAEEMQQALDDWEGGLRVTGGAIVPEKSHWYLLDFIWSQGNWRFATKKDIKAQLTVRDANGQRQVLERLEATEAKRTLGLRSPPSGKAFAELAYLREKTTEWADNIRTGHLPRNLVWQSLNTTIYKTVEYPLVACNFSKQQCDHIMSPAIAQGLASSGIVRNIAKAVRYGPLKAQGLDLMDPYVLMNIQKISFILEYGTYEHGPGKLIRHSLETMMLETGIRQWIFAQDYNRYGRLATESWLTGVWKFLWDNQLQIYDSIRFDGRRSTNDSYLMEWCVDNGYTNGQLVQINKCRLYKQVLTVSDIKTVDGSTNEKSMLVRAVPRESRRPTNVWPNQGKPSDDQWQQWTELCARLADVTLGEYQDNDSAYHWFFDASSERLYHVEQETTTYHSKALVRTGRQAHMKFNTIPNQCDSVPNRVLRATVEHGRGVLTMTHVAPSTSRTNTTQPRQSFPDELRNLPPTIKWALRDVQVDNIEGIKEALTNGTLRASCDGSYFPNHPGMSTSAWKISCNNAHIQGCNVTSGDPSVQNAYRAELAGVLACTVVISMLSSCYGISGTTTIACDNDQALSQISKRSLPTSTKNEHFDMVSAIRTWACKDDNRWETQEVKGHVKDIPGYVMNEWEELNDEMDIAAKATWYKYANTVPQSTFIDGEMWSIWHNDIKICTDLKESIRDVTSGEECRNHWIKRDRFLNAPHDVDWETTNTVMKNISLNSRRWITKNAAGVTPVGVNMKRRKEWKTDMCPRCKQVPETIEHVHLCTSQESTTLWRKGMRDIEEWLKTNQTEPKMREVLLAGVKSIRDGNPPSHHVAQLKLTCHIQQEMGWDTLLQGCAAQGWKERQNLYYKSIQSRKSGKRWLAAFLRKMLDISWDQWEHRNGIVHDKETSLQSQRCNEFIEACFLLPRNTWDSSTIKSVRNKSALLRRTTASKYAWCVRVQAALVFYKINDPVFHKIHMSVPTKTQTKTTT